MSLPDEFARIGDNASVLRRPKGTTLERVYLDFFEVWSPFFSANSCRCLLFATHQRSTISVSRCIVDVPPMRASLCCHDSLDISQKLTAMSREQPQSTSRSRENSARRRSSVGWGPGAVVATAEDIAPSRFLESSALEKSLSEVLHDQEDLHRSLRSAHKRARTEMVRADVSSRAVQHAQSKRRAASLAGLAFSLSEWASRWRLRLLHRGACYARQSFSRAFWLRVYMARETNILFGRFHEARGPQPA